MSTSHDVLIDEVVKIFGLMTLKRPVELEGLAKTWGVTSIERRPIGSEAILLPEGSGYKIVLKDEPGSNRFVRQRFSFAHELGHLLLMKAGFGEQANPRTKHRGINRSDEERLADRIGAEILMPRLAFIDDGEKAGWSLKTLTTLSKRYQTSLPATAIRMIDLMPETCQLAVWKPSANHTSPPKLDWSRTPGFRYGIPSTVSRSRLWLIVRALNADGTQSGIAPIVDKVRPTAEPIDVPAEALAWSQGEYRKAMVFYYPERELTEDMAAISERSRKLGS